ncbi:divisome protein SepX/GlpR [Crossiella sp. CA198]|uniref:divisome protein SepX/GlpR n=1 Tax=Crossiella sp. CA198 TaxID=3455607 RepID=UPI003F8D3C34
MPSSLIFAALAAAWLIVLVPMVARRRGPVARTADSALAARVVRRGGSTGTVEEVLAMPEPEDGHHDDPVEAAPDGPRRAKFAPLDGEEAAPRRYRPGRGGFDPEQAALVAEAKYAFRQRVVLAMLLLALGTGLAAGFLWPMLWWGHGAVDLLLVGYLTYLRRQVRIEAEVRERRLARLGGRRAVAEDADEAEQAEVEGEYVAPKPTAGVKPTPKPSCTSRPGTVMVEIDDGDPAFDELDPPGQVSYRRAAGE